MSGYRKVYTCGLPPKWVVTYYISLYWYDNVWELRDPDDELVARSDKPLGNWEICDWALPERKAIKKIIGDFQRAFKIKQQDEEKEQKRALDLQNQSRLNKLRRWL